jgi:hypothetical protein
MNHSILLDAGNGFSSYLWSTGDTTQTIVLDSNSWGSGAQAVWVNISNIHNCEASDTLEVSFTDCSGLSGQPGKLEFSIYPNPVKDFLYLSLPEEDFDIEILGIQGNKTFLHQATQRGEQSISVAHLPSGVYLLRIRHAGSVFTQRFVKL